MFGSQDDSVFEEFEKAELETPSARKEVDGRFIYASRELNIPKRLGLPVLCDFGSAVTGDVENLKDVQPDLYRAPEVIFGIPWSYEIDIWNAGCMVSTCTSSRWKKPLMRSDIDMGHVRGDAHVLREGPRTSRLSQSSSSCQHHLQTGPAASRARISGQIWQQILF